MFTYPLRCVLYREKGAYDLELINKIMWINIGIILAPGWEYVK